MKKDIQIDWEAILCDDPKKFEDVMFGWMKNSLSEFDVESIPDFEKEIKTPREIIKCFNYCPNVNCD